MALSRPVQLQWALDQTANNVLSVTKGLIKASLDDNVQTLALLACERFGATLAICPETTRRVENLVRKAPPPVFIKFLGEYIGYSSDDSATQLSHSDAGLRFLALSAALISSKSPFRGAEALRIMLKNSASDKSILPASRHLQDVLEALEHRLNRAGFAEIVVGYAMVLDETEAGCASDNILSQLRSKQVPDAEGIAKLVDAFRELERIGEATSITIKARSCIPWVAAFTQWCLGASPTIRCDKCSSNMPGRPDSRVSIFCSHDPDDLSRSNLRVTVYRNVGSPIDLLILVDTQIESPGMISLQCYGHWIFHNRAVGAPTLHRAFQEALPYALDQVSRLMRCTRLNEDTLKSREPGRNLTSWGINMDEKGCHAVTEEVSNLTANPFPKANIICETLSQYSGVQFDSLQTLPQGYLISDLPLVKAYLNECSEHCVCDGCKRRAQSYIHCLKEVFFHNLFRIICDVLAISLFERPKSLFLVSQRKPCVDFTEAIKDVLTSDQARACSIQSILEYALCMVGHDAQDISKDQWVVSCYKGQCVYPKVFEINTLDQSGFLGLCWTPGRLIFNERDYCRGTNSHEIFGSYGLSDPDPVTRPLDKFANQRISWNVAREDGYLDIGISYGNSQFDPFNILLNAAWTLIVEDCPHDRDKALQEADPFCKYSKPRDSFPDDSPTDDIKTLVVPVSGNDAFRALTLASMVCPTPSVLRKNACLQCCLDVCRKAGYHVVIC
ncbi:MAG: hypothetical protein M1833_005519 [Piccolia ochrophora]|nr:MAG: hypothetical protein M1833_005519 [Piccolia ochrophora]